MRLSVAPLLASLALVIAGCSATTSDARSPALDYPEPAPTTSDGQVVGADEQRPQDFIDSRPNVGTPGAKPSPRPNTTPEKTRSHTIGERCPDGHVRHDGEPPCPKPQVPPPS